MKKIKYSIRYRKVWAELYDTKIDCIMNFKCIYKGETKKDCVEWLRRYKKGLKK